MLRTACIAAALLLFSCSSDSGSTGSDVPTDMTAPDEAGQDASVTPPDATEQAAPEEVLPDGTLEEATADTKEDLSIDPADQTFVAGVAVRETFCPIGMPTAGYGQSLDKEETHSPFTVTFAASTWQQTPILAKALYLRRGGDELFLVRIDKIGTTARLVDQVTRGLEERFERPMDGKVMLASNHTHLGPGRLWENSIGAFANYLFWPSYYQRYADDIVEAAVDAFKDAEPARIGHGKTECPECHNDRRCENPPLLDSTLWVIPVERTDGTLKTLLLNFAIHGTVFHYSDNVLTGDAPGMIEQKTEEAFDHPVPVLVFQSWGGDVAPADPSIAEEQALTEAIDQKANRTERIGYAAAAHVLEALPEIETAADVEVKSITLRMPFVPELMDYEPGEWIYPNGGMLCGTNEEAPCWGEPGDPPKMGCMPLPPENKQDQITLSAAIVADMLLVSLPGEPHTDWALEALDRARAATGFQIALGLGYTNDHWGYLMKAYDWWLGGYEPTVNAWGPQQGEFLLDLIEAVAARLVDPEFKLEWEPKPMLPALTLGGPSYDPMQSKEAAQITVQPDAKPATDKAAVMTWMGGDPWYGTPVVVLEMQDGDTFAPVLRKNQTVFDNDCYQVATSLAMVPAWDGDKKSDSRDFLWTVTLPVRRNVPTPDALGPGTYRFHVTGTLLSASGKEPYDLTSEPFTVE